MEKKKFNLVFVVATDGKKKKKKKRFDRSNFARNNSIAVQSS